jgi:alkylglycerol monooxygenase
MVDASGPPPMDVDPIHLAIPVFFALIGVELLAARLLERDAYRLSDSIADLSCGVLQQLAGVFLKTALFAGYVLAFARLRLFEIPMASPWAWAGCFLGVDFLYYWFHRFSHEVNAGWAAHVVHHQSEELNLAVALRQGALQPAFSSVFYLPLALAGFPPAMFLAASASNTLYQFWIHTRLVGRLGALEWVLNTPSHHRVHHGRNPKYVDRNHGGVLIVWDRLFGTFQPEEEEPVYGITTPLRSFNPVRANLQVWVDMARKAGRTRRLRDAARLLWARPGWAPADLGGYVPPPEVDAATCAKHDPPVPGALRLYVLVQFAVLVVATTAFLFAAGGLPGLDRAAGALALVLGLGSLGGLLDGRPWAFGLEPARLALALPLLLLLPVAPGVRVAGIALAALSGAWLLRVRGRSGGARAPLPAP